MSQNPWMADDPAEIPSHFKNTDGRSNRTDPTIMSRLLGWNAKILLQIPATICSWEKPVFFVTTLNTNYKIQIMYIINISATKNQGALQKKKLIHFFRPLPYEKNIKRELCVKFGGKRGRGVWSGGKFWIVKEGKNWLKNGIEKSSNF